MKTLIVKSMGMRMGGTILAVWSLTASGSGGDDDPPDIPPAFQNGSCADGVTCLPAVPVYGSRDPNKNGFVTLDDPSDLSLYEGGGGGGYGPGSRFVNNLLDSVNAALRSAALPDPNKDGKDHRSGCMTGNPVIISSGNKVKPELDFRTGHLYPLSLIRNYNHNFAGRGLFGANWASNFDPALSFTLNNGQYYCGSAPGTDASSCIGSMPVTQVTATRPDGSQTTYTQVGGTNTYASASPDADTSILRNSDHSWTLQSQSGSTELYSPGGLVLSIKSATGIGWVFSYDVNNYLKSATHSNGQSIQFTWTNGRVTRVTDPAGSFYNYGYNAAGRLISVSYPTSPTITRTYFYENPGLPEALTGIAINGVRYSTYSYYPDGRVNSSGLLTGSVEQNTFVYGANTTQVTNAGGASATYTYQTINGNKSLVQIDQAGITNCPNTSATIHYDANGHQDYTIDQRGVKTTYVYNSIGMLQDVVGGIDPNNPGQQREAQMTWDTGKNRITNVRMLDSRGSAVLNLAYTYYPDSVAARNRLQSVVSTNLSANGVTNQTQTVNFSYSFNSSGIPAQIVIDGPGGAVTRNYDAAGNLTSVANALWVIPRSIPATTVSGCRLR